MAMADNAVGRWVIRTAELVLLRFWPPGPGPRKVSQRQWIRSC